jgi:hypothetical protein
MFPTKSYIVLHVYNYTTPTMCHCLLPFMLVIVVGIKISTIRGDNQKQALCRFLSNYTHRLTYTAYLIDS